mmetsp:Transcript_15354/g.14724  ORF Transcript_15354/g.14724 Transcript_15354/m.14724 type:complete len:396 (+) Transcript_15354:229-1416(+)
MSCLTSVECSNHGCLDPLSQICICVSGWTGKGDYSRGGLHCDINKDAITGLNITAIIVNVICCILIVIYVVKECRRKKKLYFLSFHAKALFPIFFLLHGVGDIIFNAMKIASNGERTIGYDVAITIVSSLLPPVFFTGLILYFRLIIGFLNGYARMMSSDSCAKVRTRFASLSFCSWLIPPSSLAICLVQCIGLLYPSKEDKIGQMYNIGLGFLCLSFGVIFGHSLGFLIGELGVHLKSGSMSTADIKTVSKRLKIALVIGGGLFFSMFLLCVIFGSSLLLLHRSTYLVVLFQIMMSPTATILIMTVSKISSKDSKVISSEKPNYTGSFSTTTKISGSLHTNKSLNTIKTKEGPLNTTKISVQVHPTQEEMKDNFVKISDATTTNNNELNTQNLT